MDIVTMRSRAHQPILRALDIYAPRANSQPDFDQEFLDLVAAVEPFTMTNPERVYGLREAADYILREGSRATGSSVACGAEARRW